MTSANLDAVELHPPGNGKTEGAILMPFRAQS
jgi:hypothetical protein